MREIGINTFGLSDLLNRNPDGVFDALRETGFVSVEPCVVFSGPLKIPAEALAAGLEKGRQNSFWVDRQAVTKINRIREQGLRVEGAHIGLAGITPGGLKAIIPFLGDFVEETGLKYFVHNPQKATITAAQEDITAFRDGIAKLKEQGVELLFHCHYQEFQPENGTTVFETLLNEVPELRVELDVGWVQYAGVDVVKLMRRYTNRIAVLHFKDFAASGKDKDFCAIGEGVLPLEEIIEAAQELNLSYTGYVIDQDASSGDMLEDLRIGLQNIQKYNR